MTSTQGEGDNLFLFFPPIYMIFSPPFDSLTPPQVLFSESLADVTSIIPLWILWHSHCEFSTIVKAPFKI